MQVRPVRMRVGDRLMPVQMAVTQGGPLPRVLVKVVPVVVSVAVHVLHLVMAMSVTVFPD